MFMFFLDSGWLALLLILNICRISMMICLLIWMYIYMNCNIMCLNNINLRSKLLLLLLFVDSDISLCVWIWCRRVKITKELTINKRNKIRLQKRNNIYKKQNLLSG